ncbi:histidine kinase [Bifidobacterium sp. ESL0728]|uniref:sensor histidine kinase n=1 Tax=Bifidobacterium sp. ESL0728 TaxID=2983220 RepID=UPI0023F84F9C|nr:histidine kinase [Bifidobacterium sp. ESL0728]WEV59836.1 histidine kinase [Bifidobacterium sp. ESL0728]
MNRRYLEDAARAGLLLCCALLEAARQHGSFNVIAIAGTLAAICCSALSQWLDTDERHFSGNTADFAPLPLLLFCIPALLFPEFLAFMPLVAFETMVIPSAKSEKFWHRLMRWCWILPLICSYWVYRSGGFPPIGNSHHLTTNPVLDAAIAILLSCLTALLGHALAVSDSEHHALLTLKDTIRTTRRRNATQIDSLREQQEESTRVATLRERTRIAREIHDNVGHLLTRALMQTQAASAVASATGDDTATKQLAGINASLNEAMTMVRRSVHDLEDDGTDFEAQIAEAVHMMDSVRPDFSVTLDCDIEDTPAPVARCLTSVIREALTNVIRHSDSSSASVSLHDYPAFWQLAVFNKTETKPLNHATKGISPDLRGMGLADIEQRVQALGGTSLCGPHRGGWRVFVSLPKAPWVKADTSSKMNTNTKEEETA